MEYAKIQSDETNNTWQFVRLDLDALQVKEELLPWQKRGLMYTATGFGDKIPTSKKVLYASKWRRIYCSIFSNSGTCYIVHNKTKIIVD